MKTEGKALNIVLWIVQIFGAGMFLMAGAPKLMGNEMAVQSFEMIGIGQWFRYLTGLLEVVGGIMLLAPQTAALGAILLAVVMVGAVAVHLFVIGGSPAMAVLLLLAMIFVAWGRRGRIALLSGNRNKQATA
jgi:uncharacterized membrane protein YphA (DoxX/SURF4 family)